ncbi:hypothetical protein Agabi119p4_3336 [Agaricus bisporus var. burnettii]|uniref:Hydrophobin n=1 Tax=Agaricus bisporus var. burnettii TaxID=192524 RepID=A0A8H7F6X8_AGABI|nr:hypothetical protein Agabi119p4_3336 [Agaricus bisporus var. burnettii]
MFSRVPVAILVVVPVLVSATPAPGRPQTASVVSLRNVATIIQAIKFRRSPRYLKFPSTFSVPAVLSDLPISSNNCNAQAVCCDKSNEIIRNLFSRLACSPVNVDPYEG